MTFRIEDVVTRGMCVGCGACGVATGGAIPVTLGRYGVHQADLTGVGESHRRTGSQVCPFSDESSNEDTLGPPATEAAGLPHDHRLGRHGRTLAGRRTGALLESSSGGLTSWFLGALLAAGEVDSVIHVASAAEGGAAFEYVVSDTVEAIEQRKKSFYTAPTLARVLQAVSGDGRRYALVGVPCFIRAARLLRDQDPNLGEQLVVFVGLVCGHLKSRFFAESLAWQTGIAPDALAGVDFRVKNADRPVNNYDFAAWAKGESQPRIREVGAMLDGSWGYGAFQPEACNFCDDVFAETADVVFGDAWLPKFSTEWQGTNVVVTRNPLVDRLLDAGVERGEIELEALTVDEIAASQGGNFRHRRDGLRVRLADDIAAGLPVPTKRVQPGTDHVDADRVELIRRRRSMSALSLDRFAAARAAGDFEIYAVPMRRSIAAYRAIGLPVRRRVVMGLRRVVRRIRS